ncbi:aquaporin, partial [Candidatus Saccharibacteria bacterium]|nr:aquaporin [Candidatus Saccharibacteria bacterium]
MKEKNSIVAPTALLAELVGTFILTIVAIAGGVPLVVGFTMIVLVLVLGIVSGAHVNPAVTIGLWSIKKFEGRKVPFY